MVCFFAGAIAGCQPSAPEDEYAKLQQTLQSTEGRLKEIGKVEHKTYAAGSAWSINLEGATIDEQVLADINTLDRVSELLLSGATITDEQLQSLLQSDRTSYLNVLDVSKTGITDAGLAGLAEKKYLQKLNIEGSQVTEGFVTSLDSARSANPDIPAPLKKVAVTK